MHRFDSRRARVAVAALFAAAGAQAQEVHKCTINGQVHYQALPCPSGDVVLPSAPMPSEQEQRQARTDLSRQRNQAASGRIYRPVYVPPPPPPPPPPPQVMAGSTTTTTITIPEPGRGPVVVRQTTSAPSPQPVSPPNPNQKPLSNCEKLNRDNVELQDRRDQLRAPGELATRRDLLQKAEADLAHVQEMARASTCKLAR
jgi:hypothetical protein